VSITNGNVKDSEEKNHLLDSYGIIKQKIGVIITHNSYINYVMC
jgi:hypothetical protein